VASTARRYDKATDKWVDRETLYLRVTCWRALAENVERSMIKGDPVVVTGRLSTRMYDVEGGRRASYELEAAAVGFDLSRGTADFKRVVRSAGVTVDEVGPDGLPGGLPDGLSEDEPAGAEVPELTGEPGSAGPDVSIVLTDADAPRPEEETIPEEEAHPTGGRRRRPAPAMA
jgi:single-strand DNA-binding protein